MPTQGAIPRFMASRLVSVTPVTPVACRVYERSSMTPTTTRPFDPSQPKNIP